MWQIEICYLQYTRKWQTKARIQGSPRIEKQAQDVLDPVFGEIQSPADNRRILITKQLKHSTLKWPAGGAVLPQPSLQRLNNPVIELNWTSKKDQTTLSQLLLGKFMHFVVYTTQWSSVTCSKGNLIKKR